MMFLKSIFIFIGSFFGLFVVISALIALIFPCSWNDVVSCPGWIAVYVLFGGILSGFIVDDFNTEKL